MSFMRTVFAQFVRGELKHKSISEVANWLKHGQDWVLATRLDLLRVAVWGVEYEDNNQFNDEVLYHAVRKILWHWLTQGELTRSRVGQLAGAAGIDSNEAARLIRQHLHELLDIKFADKK